MRTQNYYVKGIKMKTLKITLTVVLLGLFITAAVWGAWDKDVPTAGTSMRSSNPLILANQSAIQTSLDAEHDFGSSTQTGSHTPGSARAFFQDDAPTTQIDGDAFAATDLGSLWFDSNASIDNQFSVLTATTPTWTPVSTEIIAFMLASGRVFTSTLGVTGNFAVNTNKFTVAASTGHTAVAGNLSVAGGIDPTSYLTSRGGFKDQDTMSGNSATAVASQQSIKAYTDNQITAHVPSDMRIKAWTRFDGTDTITNGDNYNVTSVVRDSAGLYTITWDTDFSNAYYCATVTTNGRTSRINAQAAGTLQVATYNSGGTITDASIVCVIAIGDQ